MPTIAERLQSLADKAKTADVLDDNDKLELKLISEGRESSDANVLKRDAFNKLNPIERSTAMAKARVGELRLED